MKSVGDKRAKVKGKKNLEAKAKNWHQEWKHL